MIYQGASIVEGASGSIPETGNTETVTMQESRLLHCLPGERRVCNAFFFSAATLCLSSLLLSLLFFFSGESSLFEHLNDVVLFCEKTPFQIVGHPQQKLKLLRHAILIPTVAALPPQQPSPSCSWITKMLLASLLFMVLFMAFIAGYAAKNGQIPSFKGEYLPLFPLTQSSFAHYLAMDLVPALQDVWAKNVIVEIMFPERIEVRQFWIDGFRFYFHYYILQDILTLTRPAVIPKHPIVTPLTTLHHELGRNKFSIDGFVTNEVYTTIMADFILRFYFHHALK